MTATETLIRQLIGGDRAAAARIAGLARTSDEPVLLVAAALVAASLLDPSATDLLARASLAASTTGDRQLAVIAAAHLGGDIERVHMLARDHLADHPDSLLVAWIASSPNPEGTPS